VLKGPLNFFFLAFCGVIYQNLLHRRVYIAVSSYKKLLFDQFCEKQLHITLTARHRAILLRPSVQFPAIPRDIVFDLPVRQRYWFRRHAARHWATARLLWRQPKPGTLCQIMSGTRLHCSPSVANLKLYCLGSRTLISCHVTDYLWSPYGIGQTIIFSCCGLFYLSFFLA